MSKYESKDLYEVFKEFHSFIENRVDSFNRVDSLPVLGAKKEIAARKRAAEILIPIMQQTEALMLHYRTEAYGSEAIKDFNDNTESLW